MSVTKAVTEESIVAFPIGAATQVSQTLEVSLETVPRANGIADHHTHY